MMIELTSSALFSIYTYNLHPHTRIQNPQSALWANTFIKLHCNCFNLGSKLARTATLNRWYSVAQMSVCRRRVCFRHRVVFTCRWQYLKTKMATAKFISNPDVAPFLHVFCSDVEHYYVPQTGTALNAGTDTAALNAGTDAAALNAGTDAAALKTQMQMPPHSMQVQTPPC